jgi:hypothetical protein
MKYSAKPRKTKTLTKERTIDSLALFLRAIKEAYAKDKCQPGLVLSWLEDKQLFYASICRYDGYQASNKTVVTSETGTTIAEVLRKLSVKWLSLDQNLKQFATSVEKGVAF